MKRAREFNKLLVDRYGELVQRGAQMDFPERVAGCAGAIPYPARDTVMAAPGGSLYEPDGSPGWVGLQPQARISGQEPG